MLLVKSIMAMAVAASNDSSSSSSSSSSMSRVSSPAASSVVFVDLYGKRRQVAKVQVLDREISLLQDEIKSLVELQPASRCCKELDDYVEATPDPLIAINQVRGRSRSFWKNSRQKIGWMICCCCCCCNTTCLEDCCGGNKSCCCCKSPAACNPTCPTSCSVCISC